MAHRALTLRVLTCGQAQRALALPGLIGHGPMGQATGYRPKVSDPLGWPAGPWPKGQQATGERPKVKTFGLRSVIFRLWLTVGQDP